MKIAILTLPFHVNYGCIIQNYALQTILKRMGHDVWTINIISPKAKIPLRKFPLSMAKRFIKKMLGHKDGILFREKKINKDKIIAEQYTKIFINKYIQLTKPYYNKKELLEINNENFNAIIVGSDQVWRIPYVYPDIETYFLDFIHDKRTKKIAYSASFGTDKIEFSKMQSKRCKELIKQFDLITVREDVGLDLINKSYKWVCSSVPQHTLDPAMLLSKEDYINLSSEYVDHLNGELFYYILDMTEDKKRVLEQISKELGYKPFTVMSKSNNWYDNSNDKIAPPLELWLQAFNKAKYIFTDSFHGCVFSIIFNKDFIVYGNPKRGMSRFTSLLNLFQINDRLILDSNESNSQLIISHINWNNVNNILENNKRKALNLLQSHLQ